MAMTTRLEILSDLLPGYRNNVVGLDEVLHEDALDFLDSPEATIVTIEAHGFVPNGSRQLNGVRRAEAVAGTQLGRPIS